MSDPGVVIVNDEVRIPSSELSYRASRSGGPGGQHVNTSSTQVELTWDASSSPSLSEEARARIMEKLANRIDTRGVLHLSASGSRSQAQNRAEVTERFRSLLAEALVEPKRRRRTRPPRSADEARLREKRRRAELKRRRGPVDDPE